MKLRTNHFSSLPITFFSRPAPSPLSAGSNRHSTKRSGDLDASVGKTEGLERGEMGRMGRGEWARFDVFFSLLGCMYACLRGLFVLRPQYRRKEGGDRGGGFGEGRGGADGEEARAGEDEKERKEETLRYIKSQTPSQPHPFLLSIPPRG